MAELLALFKKVKSLFTVNHTVAGIVGAVAAKSVYTKVALAAVAAGLKAATGVQ